MALSTPRIIGRQLTLTVTGFPANTATIWQNLTVGFTGNTANATAADSTLDEVVLTTALLEASIDGYLGSVNNGGTLPAVGATVTNLAVAVGADSVIPSLTNYTNIKVIKADYKFQQEPSTWALSLRSGVLNSLAF